MLPLSVELVSISSINLPELLLKIWSKVDGRVEILPDESVMLNILDKILLGHISCGEVPNSIHRYYTYVFYGS